MLTKIQETMETNRLKNATERKMGSRVVRYLVLKLKKSEMMFSINELFEDHSVINRKEIFNIFGRSFMESVFQGANSLGYKEREILKLLLYAQDKDEFLDKMKLIQNIGSDESQTKELCIEIQ